MATDDILVRPASSIGGTVTVPGDKSISHRVAMMTGLASGKSTITGFLESEDCLNTLAAVEKLGAVVEKDAGVISIIGTGGAFSRPEGILDIGNSGTGLRLLAGVLAGQDFSSELTGDESLRSRPMSRIKEPLELMGAEIGLTGENGCAPITVKGNNLKGIEYELPVASAQVKSCVLLAGLYATGTTTVIEPRPTRDHTELMLKAMGADIKVDGSRVSIEGSAGAPVSLKQRDWNVPGDFSSAAFWIAAGACREGSGITIEDVGINPRRTALLDVLKRMGAKIEIKGQRSEIRDNQSWEVVGDIVVKGAGLTGTEVGGDEIPNIIDELPLVAVLGAMAEGKTVIRDAAELRVKESDRIATMAEGLRALGVTLEEKPDGMIIEGGGDIIGGTDVDSYGDHRVAMALSVLAFFAESPVTIRNTACIATSYPSFWTDLERIIS